MGLFFILRYWELYQIDKIVNSIKLTDILKQNVRASVWQLQRGGHWIVQQNNNSKHMSKLTKAKPEKKSWKLLEWPLQSPKLNPTENLSLDLTKPNSTHKPKKLNDLEGFAQAESAKNIARSFCQAIPIMNEENNDHEKFFPDC